MQLYEDVNYAAYSMSQLEDLSGQVQAEKRRTYNNYLHRPDLNRYIRKYAMEHYDGLPKLNDPGTIDSVVTEYVREHVKPQFSAEERAKDENMDSFPYYDETYEMWYSSLIYLILEDAEYEIDKLLEIKSAA